VAHFDPKWVAQNGAIYPRGYLGGSFLRIMPQT
jgi:hypothetical protein